MKFSEHLFTGAAVRSSTHTHAHIHTYHNGVKTEVTFFFSSKKKAKVSNTMINLVLSKIRTLSMTAALGLPFSGVWKLYAMESWSVWMVCVWGVFILNKLTVDYYHIVRNRHKAREAKLWYVCMLVCGRPHGRTGKWNALKISPVTPY